MARIGLATIPKFEVLAPGRLSPPRDAATRRAEGRPPRGLRRLAHALAIVAGWALFFWGWQRVLASSPDFAELRLLMIGAAIVVPVVTVSWILHNRGIHRRKGPRRSVAEAHLDYRVDFHGREVLADWAALARAQRVDIVIDGAFKRYQEGAALRDAKEGAALRDASP